jgi:molybdopterin-synthase adenylyltransferase
VTDFGLIDHDITTESSLNRLIGALASDIANKTAKVAVAQRLITAIQPAAAVRAFPFALQDERTGSAFAHADVCFSCLDDDLARVALIERCREHGLVFFDLATDTEDTDALRYGGRVLFSGAGERCPYCMDLLDPAELSRRSLPSDASRAARQIYGVRHDELGATGPAVVSLTEASLPWQSPSSWSGEPDCETPRHS